MTKRFRDTIASGDTIAHYFGKAAIAGILNQDGCVGIRLYYALNAESEEHLVAVGVNADGNDLYNGVLAERTYTCPEYCSASNPLNTTVTTFS